MNEFGPLARSGGPSRLCACAASTGRLGPTHALILLIALQALGSGLFLAGTSLSTVFALVGGLGAIGAGTLTLARGGRRLAAVVVEAAVRSGTGK
ncbi:hypothetical protein [Streptomyces griseosporeus]|jgi:hypothetical protein|uniref:hypothetical protein n=1 Tax=Streptomyces griseosporeus TaxID=1910 RepID=UPI00369C82F3